MKSRNTWPERQLQGGLDEARVRYRTHASELPGTPDVVLDAHRIAVFVHGCHWHRHLGCTGARVPRSNTLDWLARFQSTVLNDQAVARALRDQGWWVYVAWECALRQDGKGIVLDLMDLMSEREAMRTEQGGWLVKVPQFD